MLQATYPNTMDDVGYHHVVHPTELFWSFLVSIANCTLDLHDYRIGIVMAESHMTLQWCTSRATLLFQCPNIEIT